MFTTQHADSKHDAICKGYVNAKTKQQIPAHEVQSDRIIAPYEEYSYS